MRGFWLFVHNLSYCLWIGAGIATMLAGVAAKRLAPADRLLVYRITARIQSGLVGPGVVGTLLSGILLMMPYMKSGAAPNWMYQMMSLGLLGGLIQFTLAVSTAARLGRLELDPRGELPEVFHSLRKRLIWTATIGGGLALLSLAAATIGRF